MNKQLNDAQLDKLLDDKVAQLSPAMQPQKDLWKGIDLAIEGKEQRSATKPAKQYWATAAAVCLVAILGWQLKPVNQNNTPKLVSLPQQMTQEFEQQKSLLLTSYQGTQPLTDNWQQQLAELDKAARVVRDALAQDPNNQQLLFMLQGVYQQQLELINKTHRKEPQWQQI